jgi:hypothetical protein
MSDKNRTVVRPSPASTTQSNTPSWHLERIQAEDEWTRQAQLAISDLQKRVKALEDRVTTLET